jgi:hypothetical protein
MAVFILIPILCGRRSPRKAGTGRLVGFYLSAMTSISKSSGVNASARLNLPSVAPWMEHG